MPRGRHARGLRNTQKHGTQPLPGSMAKGTQVELWYPAGSRALSWERLCCHLGCALVAAGPRCL